MKDNAEILPEQPSGEPAQDSSTPPAFDFESVRLGQNFDGMVGVKKALVTVPTRKPNRQSFIRVRPGEEWRLQTQIIELKDEKEVYVVDRTLWGDLAQEVVPVTLFVAIDRQGVLFVWPVKLPRDRALEWHRSAMEAAQRAMDTWISVRANMHLSAYEVFEATGDLGDPDWPAATFGEILAVAFRDRVIDSFDHDLLKRLRGEL